MSTHLSSINLLIKGFLKLRSQEFFLISPCAIHEQAVNGYPSTLITSHNAVSYHPYCHLRVDKDMIRQTRPLVLNGLEMNEVSLQK